MMIPYSMRDDEPDLHCGMSGVHLEMLERADTAMQQAHEAHEQALEVNKRAEDMLKHLDYKNMHAPFYSRADMQAVIRSHMFAIDEYRKELQDARDEIENFHYNESFKE